MTTTDTTTRTEGQALADRLRTVANHLIDHPHLPVVEVSAAHYDIPSCQITSPKPDHLAHLLTWVDTLTVRKVVAYSVKGQAYVHVHASCESGALQVWAVVPGLAELHGWADTDDDREITLDALRDFATSTTRVEDIEQAHAEAYAEEIERLQNANSGRRVMLRSGEPQTRESNVVLAHAEALHEDDLRAKLHAQPQLLRHPLLNYGVRLTVAHELANQEQAARGGTRIVAPRRVPTIRTTDGTDSVLVTVDHGIDTDTDDRDIPVVVLRVGTGVAYLTLDQADELIEHLHDAAQRAYRGNADSANIAGELVLGGTR